MLRYNIDTEYDSWLLEKAQSLRDRDFKHLDIDNLVFVFFLFNYLICFYSCFCSNY